MIKNIVNKEYIKLERLVKNKKKKITKLNFSIK